MMDSMELNRSIKIVPSCVDRLELGFLLRCMSGYGVEFQKDLWLWFTSEMDVSREKVNINTLIGGEYKKV